MAAYEIRLVEAKQLKMSHVTDLFRVVGWENYSRNPTLLEKAIHGSSVVVVAISEGELVGLARSLTDGITLMVIQDVVVHPAKRRLGIGSQLVQALQQRAPQVRIQILLTEPSPSTLAFYERLGFSALNRIDDRQLVTLAKS